LTVINDRSTERQHRDHNRHLSREPMSPDEDDD